MVDRRGDVRLAPPCGESRGGAGPKTNRSINGSMTINNVAQSLAVRPLASFNGLDLSVPECSKGIGAVIGSPESTDLIDGVKMQRLPLYPDDRGYFLEVQRFGQGLAANFPAV